MTTSSECDEISSSSRGEGAPEEIEEERHEQHEERQPPSGASGDDDVKRSESTAHLDAEMAGLDKEKVGGDDEAPSLMKHNSPRTPTRTLSSRTKLLLVGIVVCGLVIGIAVAMTTANAGNGTGSDSAASTASAAADRPQSGNWTIVEVDNAATELDESHQNKCEGGESTKSTLVNNEASGPAQPLDSGGEDTVETEQDIAIDPNESQYNEIDDESDGNQEKSMVPEHEGAFNSGTNKPATVNTKPSQQDRDESTLVGTDLAPQSGEAVSIAENGIETDITATESSLAEEERVPLETIPSDCNTLEINRAHQKNKGCPGDDAGDTAARANETVAVSSKAYVPGDLTTLKEGILLSRGLDVRIIAQSGWQVVLADGSLSRDKFHFNPDFGGVFAAPEDDEDNLGGYVYVSNSEIPKGAGGVGALTFNSDGEIISYRMVLKRTSMNCGGGHTPWNTWISCEEKSGVRNGMVYQVEPFGSGDQPRRKTSLGGKTGGSFESFAFDVRDVSNPRFYVTEDHPRGSLRRFTPDPASIDWSRPNLMLYGNGTMEYLLLFPEEKTYRWTKDKDRADRNAKANYRNSEGIQVDAERLYFVSKRLAILFILDLDGDSYEEESTKWGLFDGSPDQIVRLIGGNSQSLLYFTEEGSGKAGIHARDAKGRYYTILESPVFHEETTGLAFSPDHRHMILAYQKNGIVLQVRRTDGGAFSGRALNVRYHTTVTGSD